MSVGWIASQEGEVLVAPELHLDQVVGPGEGGAEEQKDDLRHWIEYFGGLARVLERRKVADEGRVGALIHVASPPLSTPTNQKPTAPDTLKPIHPIALAARQPSRMLS